MTQSTRDGVATICYGVAAALVGGLLYLIDLGLVQLVGAVLMLAAVVLAVVGLVQVARGQRAA